RSIFERSIIILTTPNQAKRWRRSEVPAEQTWDITDLFPSQEAWENELEALKTDVTTVTKYKGKLGEAADTLLSGLDALSDFQKRLIRTATYANLKASADGSDPD